MMFFNIEMDFFSLNHNHKKNENHFLLDFAMLNVTQVISAPSKEPHIDS